ncbi:MAG: hypothetical protein NQU46_04945 [Methanolinea sp.]|nr:hypothetical protein [Methanolinea sp.]
MAWLNDEGQWIILMGFIISVGIFFLALLVNQSILVGQTTAEAVLDFPKSDIQDLRNEVWVIYSRYNNTPSEQDKVIRDIEVISLIKKNAVVNITPGMWRVHYFNGITNYTEVIYDANNTFFYFYY